MFERGMTEAKTSVFSPFSMAAPGKRVCFWGAPVDSTLPSGDYIAQLGASGGNTGNMFIGYGLYNNLICNEKSYHPGFHRIPPDLFHEYYDLVVIPASNFVNNSTDLEAHYNYFSQTKVSMICFGLGSQLLPNREVALQPGTERFLRLVSERSGSIGVRGTFTAEILWKLGIQNLSIVGCPSLLNLGSDQLQNLRENRPTLEKIGVNFSNNVRSHSVNGAAMRATENNLFERAIHENSFYVIQNELPEVDLLAAIATGRTDRIPSALDRICASFQVLPARSDVTKYLTTRLRIFFTVPDWLGSTATMTASIGSRFHGNIAAILSGVPALFLVHDMRTLELCEHFRVPHVNLNKAYEAEDIIGELLNCDYGPFTEQMPRIQTEWRLFAARNGLSVIARGSDCETVN